MLYWVGINFIRDISARIYTFKLGTLSAFLLGLWFAGDEKYDKKY
jgi:hypothetical protein